MKWLFRPSVLVVLSLAFVAGAVAVWVRFLPDSTGPAPLPVAPGDREIVWLAQATSAASWERFVAALKLTEDRLKADVPGLHADVDPAKAFPQQSTVAPEATLTWDGAGGKLVFRWYKLTSDRKLRDWVQALLKDRPAPLAIIGGSNSDNARDLALQLRAATEGMAVDKRPLLFLTTATADRVSLPADVPRMNELDLDLDPARPAHLPQTASLNRLYRERTFRFCFSNQQMSRALTDFIWSRADLKPVGPPIHLVQWTDDTYSSDLVNGFVKALQPHETEFLRGHAGESPFSHKIIELSVGTFDTANRFEAMQVSFFINELDTSRPLDRTPLVLAGQTLPSRRFLREFARTMRTAHANRAEGLDRGNPLWRLFNRMDPIDRADVFRRFYVVTGDAISFNTVYRDRLVTWHIKDLPFPLLFFCHADPIDERAGFRPHKNGVAAVRELGDTGATGTEDVLLYVDILSALVQGAGSNGPADASPLADRLRKARYHAGRVDFGNEGELFFNSDGDRATGTGEHIVWLQPAFDPPGRIMGHATITVFTLAGQVWSQHGELLNISYEPPAASMEEPR